PEGPPWQSDAEKGGKRPSQGLEAPKATKAAAEAAQAWGSGPYLPPASGWKLKLIEIEGARFIPDFAMYTTREIAEPGRIILPAPMCSLVDQTKTATTSSLEAIRGLRSNPYAQDLHLQISHTQARALERATASHPAELHQWEKRAQESQEAGVSKEGELHELKTSNGHLRQELARWESKFHLFRVDLVPLGLLSRGPALGPVCKHDQYLSIQFYSYSTDKSQQQRKYQKEFQKLGRPTGSGPSTCATSLLTSLCSAHPSQAQIVMNANRCPAVTVGVASKLLGFIMHLYSPARQASNTLLIGEALSHASSMAVREAQWLQRSMVGNSKLPAAGEGLGYVKQLWKKLKLRSSACGWPSPVLPRIQHGTGRQSERSPVTASTQPQWWAAVGMEATLGFLESKPYAEHQPNRKGINTRKMARKAATISWSEALNKPLRPARETQSRAREEGKREGGRGGEGGEGREEEETLEAPVERRGALRPGQGRGVQLEQLQAANGHLAARASAPPSSTPRHLGRGPSQSGAFFCMPSPAHSPSPGWSVLGHNDPVSPAQLPTQVSWASCQNEGNENAFSILSSYNVEAQACGTLMQDNLAGLSESRMLLPTAISSYLASPPGRRERSGQAHLCEALLQAEAEAEPKPKPRAKLEPENLRALSMAPLTLLARPTAYQAPPNKPVPQNPAGQTSSTAAASTTGHQPGDSGQSTGTQRATPLGPLSRLTSMMVSGGGCRLRTTNRTTGPASFSASTARLCTTSDTSTSFTRSTHCSTGDDLGNKDARIIGDVGVVDATCDAEAQARVALHKCSFHFLSWQFRLGVEAGVVPSTQGFPSCAKSDTSPTTTTTLVHTCSYQSRLVQVHSGHQPGPLPLSLGVLLPGTGLGGTGPTSRPQCWCLCIALPPAARTPQPTPASTPPPPGSRAHSHCSDQEGGGTRGGALAERGLGPGGRPGASAPTLPRTHGSPSSTGGSVSPVLIPANQSTESGSGSGSGRNAKQRLLKGTAPRLSPISTNLWATADPRSSKVEIPGRGTGSQRMSDSATAQSTTSPQGTMAGGDSFLRLLPNRTGSELCLGSINRPPAQPASPKPRCQELGLYAEVIDLHNCQFGDQELHVAVGRDPRRSGLERKGGKEEAAGSEAKRLGGDRRLEKAASEADLHGTRRYGARETGTAAPQTTTLAAGQVCRSGQLPACVCACACMAGAGWRGKGGVRTERGEGGNTNSNWLPASPKPEVVGHFGNRSSRAAPPLNPVGYRGTQSSALGNLLRAGTAGSGTRPGALSRVTKTCGNRTVPSGSRVKGTRALPPRETQGIQQKRDDGDRRGSPLRAGDHKTGPRLRLVETRAGLQSYVKLLILVSSTAVSTPGEAHLLWGEKLPVEKSLLWAVIRSGNTEATSVVLLRRSSCIRNGTPSELREQGVSRCQALELVLSPELPCCVPHPPTFPHLTITSVSNTVAPHSAVFRRDIKVFSGANWERELVIEKDEPDVQPSQGEEEGEEEQAKPETVTLQRGRREVHSRSPFLVQSSQGMAVQERFLPSIGLLWQLYRQWRQRAQTEQQLGDSAMLSPTSQTGGTATYRRLNGSSLKACSGSKVCAQPRGRSGHVEVGAPELDTGLNGRCHEDARTDRTNSTNEQQ
ncbi:hypothetical protein J0S82_001292, partial [Galemys pyrenaicus]